MTQKKAAASSSSSAILSFFGAAAKDYIAARVLLNAQLPVQGAILASTAIEKYFKTIMALRGNSSTGHLRKAHWNSVKNYAPEIFVDINPAFLVFLQRCYKMRYPDTLPPGFNLVIASREFLAELDEAAMLLHYGMGLKNRGEVVGTDIETYRKNRDVRLLLNNHVITGQSKQAFIKASPQFVYEMRVDPIRGFIEVYYIAKPLQSDGMFLREGFKPAVDDPMSYDLAFKVLQHLIAPPRIL